MWGKPLTLRQKERVLQENDLAAPCFSLRPALLVLEVPRADTQPCKNKKL